VTGESGRLNQIDVLRGFAALWVLLSHYLPHWEDYLGPVPLFVHGPWGIHAVELFFVISGFVIFMTLRRCRSVLDFVVLRFSRLYPAYWASIIGVAALSALLFHAKPWVGGILTNLTMLQEFFGFKNIDNVYWSLTVELAFYLNVSWLFALGLTRRRRAVVLCWLMASCIWAVALRDPGADQRDRYALFLALDYAPYFAIGICAYDALERGWSAAGAGLVLFAIASEYLIGGVAAVGIAATITVMFLLALHGQLRLLVCRPTLWLGGISYSLYLVHRNIGYLALDWLHAHDVPARWALPLAIAGALALATLLTHGVERPVLRRIRRWYDRRPGAAPATAA
jgi:peptidoglycan/LPS O-acetylase OafA/YrhL